MGLCKRVWLLTLAIFVVGATAPRAQAQTAPEVTALAAALKNDPDLIYEYVYNNIETIPIYGSLKGPLGALLDSSGTPFDQAELMVQLLQQAALNNSAITNPKFQIGTVWLSQSQVSNWTGLDASLAGVSTLLSEGGIPSAYIVAGTDPTKFDCVAIQTAWVQVTISGTAYVFEPAFKLSNQTLTDLQNQPSACTSHGTQIMANGLDTVAGVNLATATGYSQSTFVSNAMSGATTTSNSITGLNRTNIRNNLTTYSNNLVSWIRTNMPSASTDDILGGRTIKPLAVGTHQRWMSLPYLCSNSVSSLCSSVSTSSSMDPSYRTTLSITMPGASSPYVLNSSDAYGHRLSMSVKVTNNSPTNNYQAKLFFDGTVVVDNTVNWSTYPVTLPLQIAVASPASSLSTTNTINFAAPQQWAAIEYYAIANGWGGVSRSIIERYRKDLLKYRQTYPNKPNWTSPADDRGASGDLQILGASWMAQVAQARSLIEKVAGVKTILPYSIGIVGRHINLSTYTDAAPYVDLPLNLVGELQLTGRPTGGATALESAAFFAHAGMASGLESAVIKQTQPNGSAVSTVTLLDAVATAQIFDINNSTISGDDATYWTNTIKPQMVYPPSDLSRMDSLVVSGNQRIIAAKNGLQQPTTSWSGAGYFAISQSTSTVGAIPGLAFNAIITGGLSGGYGVSYVSASQSGSNFSSLQLPSVDNPNPGNTITSPIAGVGARDGSYNYAHQDLILGLGLPYGVSAGRRYSSSSQYAVPGAFGRGWSYDFMLMASRDSDAYAGMAAASPISGASAIAALYAIKDIYTQGVSGPIPLNRILMGVVAQQWMVDQMTENAVNVLGGPAPGEYVKLADGTYNAPFGSSATLIPGTGYLDLKLTYSDKSYTMFYFSAASPLGRGDGITWPNGAFFKIGYKDCSSGQVMPSSVYGSAGSGKIINFTYGETYWHYCVVTSITDGTRTVNYGYTGENLTSVTDANGKVTTYTYDGVARLTQVRTPSFPTTPFLTNTYNGIDQVTAQQDGNGHTTTIYPAFVRSEINGAANQQAINYYSQKGDLVLSIDGLGHKTSRTYDGLHRLVSQTAPEGNSITYAYDNTAPGRLYNVLSKTQTPKPGSGSPALVTSYTYDSTYNKVATITDPNGNVTTNVYDVTGGTGNLKEVNRPTVGGQVPKTTYTYTSKGQVATITDPMGVVTKYNYDSYNNVSSVVRDYGGLNLTTTNNTIDAVGNVTNVSTPDGNRYLVTYDGNRRITQIQGPANSSNTLLSIAQTTKFTYNFDGLLTKIERATGNSSAPWQTTNITYSPTFKKLTVVDPNNNTTTYTYDVADRLQTVTDAVSRTTTYAYDVLDRLVSKSNAAIQTAPLEAYTYTTNGQRQTLTDGNGNKSTFVYDGLDRLVSVQYPVLTRGAGSSNTSDVDSYTHDANGNVLTFTRRDGAVITSTYDVLNRLITKAFPGHVNDVYYTYDLADRMLSARYGSFTGSGVIYAYDAVGRMTSEATSGRTMSYLYDSMGNRTRVTWPDGFYVSYSYDALNRVTAVGENGATTTPGRLVTYTYDLLSRRQVAAYGNGGSVTSGFDIGDRLISLVHAMPSGGTSYNQSLAFGYTNANQLSSRTSSNVAYEWVNTTAATTNSTFDGLNRDSAIAALTNGYDARGNLTNDGARTFTYDVLNRLTGATVASSSTSVSLSYDPQDRLSQQVTTVGAGSPVTTQFLYDGPRLVAELDGSGNVLRRYAHGPGTDEPVVWYEGSSTTDRRWLHPDERGSIIAYSNLSGAVTTYNYGPYGEPNTWTGSRYAYTGQIRLPEVQLYHYKARVFDPVMGRFLQTDPSGASGGPNLYLYAASDPVNLTDPNGLRPVTLGEWSILFGVFQTSVDYSRIDIVQGSGGNLIAAAAFAAGTPAITLGQNIYINDKAMKWSEDYSEVGDMGTLGHEVTHISQYQRGVTPIQIAAQSLSKQIFGHDPYDISGVSSTTTYTSLGYEQQAEVVRGLINAALAGDQNMIGLYGGIVRHQSSLSNGNFPGSTIGVYSPGQGYTFGGVGSPDYSLFGPSRFEGYIVEYGTATFTPAGSGGIDYMKIN